MHCIWYETIEFSSKIKNSAYLHYCLMIRKKFPDRGGIPYLINKEMLNLISRAFTSGKEYQFNRNVFLTPAPPVRNILILSSAPEIRTSINRVNILKISLWSVCIACWANWYWFPSIRKCGTVSFLSNSIGSTGFNIWNASLDLMHFWTDPLAYGKFPDGHLVL